MYYPRKDNTLSMLAGAAVGAFAMYLLDPDAGRRRRRGLAECTGAAAHRAGETLAPVWDRVSNTARNVGASVAGGTASFGHGMADRLSAKFSEARDSGNETAHHLRDALADKLEHAKSRIWHREESSHAGAYAATGLGTLALGVAAMYLLDPQRGRDRRARLMDQASSFVRRTGHTCRRIGRDLGNRAKGYAHEARGRFETEDSVSAERLLQRIRSELGHVVSHPGAIQEMTDNDGCVTLHGKVLASEADKMLSTVKGVGGVNEVINLMSVKETEQQMHETDPMTAATRI
jgi:gas vesicle protein